MKIFLKGTKAVFAIFVIMMAALSLWQVISVTVLKQEQPELFGYSHLAVLSGSMEPAISAGDLIIIHRQKEYDTGDIITFSEEGSYTTHRITGLENGTFRTRGDANNVEDERPVAGDRIRGRVILVIPAAGEILLFLRTPVGLLGILLLGAAGFFAVERVNCKKEGCSR